MAEIHVLDNETIDKIAAGEVVERPSSVVKELVENALDAGANAITVEIRDGGISMIRVTDNGEGMEKEQIRKAFLRHATSKIQNADDLSSVHSLGFRGEALSSIAAVSQVEIITKTPERLTGVRYCIEGGVEKDMQEIGAPEGTTFVMRNLFFNTPVRKKFLKQAPTEGGYVADLMEHLALSRPDVSFRFQMGTQTRFHTSGNGDLREVIYRIYGREIANALVPIQAKEGPYSVEGYLGKPILVRSNRNFEIYFVNGRFVKSNVVAKAVEEGYKEYLMQHKFPFCVLHFTLDTERVDVNVHPTKMDVRFSEPFEVADFLMRSVKNVLVHKEMIPQERLGDEKALQAKEKKEREEENKVKHAEPFEQRRITLDAVAEESSFGKNDAKNKPGDLFEKSPVWERVRSVSQKPENTAPMPVKPAEKKGSLFFEETSEEPVKESKEEPKVAAPKMSEEVSVARGMQPQEAASAPAMPEETAQTPVEPQTPKQMNLFEEKILTQRNRDQYHIIGQIFDTYWMFEYQDKLCILDQHAAHEKVKYERFMKRYREKEILSQNLFPPVIVSLSGQEEATLHEYAEVFKNLGFEVESFGGNEYCLRSVPVDLYGCGERELFLSILDELEAGVQRQNPQAVEEKIASMSCKAAVKGNHRLSYEEADQLIDELLTLDNPYNCPHGRPTIITISKYEMEKKFKRIV
ncbi:MAG: DNA mismatch repair endonuclease MutL [Lachnospiraceae bacterium]|nr:DNA mismatch repair endonuclease MutL [Lachnospiraceae bacterium]